MVNEIERLKGQGYNNVQIAKKLDICQGSVSGLLTLKHDGEEGLMDAALRGSIPVGVAIDIAKAESIEAQRELLKAYKNGDLNQASIRTVKRLIEQRRFMGKAIRGDPRGKVRATSADVLVNAYKRESQRQKMIVKTARICEGKLTVLIEAFSKLVADEAFNNLLRAEGLRTMPQFLAEKLEPKS